MDYAMQHDAFGAYIWTAKDHISMRIREILSGSPLTVTKIMDASTTVWEPIVKSPFTLNGFPGYTGILSCAYALGSRKHAYIVSTPLSPTFI